MVLIDYPDPEDTSPAVREVLRNYEAENDRYSSLQLAIANNPGMFDVFDRFYRDVMMEGTLDVELKQLAHVTVSVTNRCQYCIASHTENLVEDHDAPPARIDAIADGDLAAFDERERSVVEFARQVADDPKRVQAEHVEALLEAGFTEETVIELLLLTAQAVLANTMADALNVRPEDHAETLAEYRQE